ncbi:proteasome subunit alpha [Halorubellus sp. JP-L1]|uniref:proteasome subunit alpha n=1 Tax=Halorubellus sp. JP-L1 TaxID=2715753 RepID=UPI00140E15CE|nr:proteasome subunit alpha [Halorubellus sp. JP-L1]NHN40593.1 proteasome subunit alpha [Halorubellus sp. JP-L1]
MNGGSDRQAYDRGVSVFSPDGRLYQVEYAREAVRNGTAVVGVRGDDGVVLAADARTRSSLLVDGSVEKLHDLDGRLGAATAGHVADGRRIVDFARRRAQTERLRYDQPVDVEPLATAIADHVQEATQAGGTRPFGAGLLVAGVDATDHLVDGGAESTDDLGVDATDHLVDGGAESTDYHGDDHGDGSPEGADDAAVRLYEVDPSGSPSEWHATAIGGGTDAARSHLEAHYEPGLDVLGARDLALTGLASTVEDDGFAPSDVSLAVVDDSGYRTLGEGERASALDEAGVRRAS